MEMTLGFDAQFVTRRSKKPWISELAAAGILQAVERLGVSLQNLVSLGIADPALVRP